MRQSAAETAILLSLVLVACQKPDRAAPTESAEASPSAANSDAPIDPGGFPNVPEGMKLIMSGFGQVVVADTFQDKESGFLAPPGFTADTSYVALAPDGSLSARFAIAHKEEAGTSVPDPDINHLGEKAATAAPCPGWASDNAQKEFVRGSVAHFRCAKGPFGGGVVATLRKQERIYELLCTGTGDKGAEACVKVLGQFRPN